MGSGRSCTRWRCRSSGRDRGGSGSVPGARQTSTRGLSHPRPGSVNIAVGTRSVPEIRSTFDRLAAPGFVPPVMVDIPHFCGGHITEPERELEIVAVEAEMDGVLGFQATAPFLSVPRQKSPNRSALPSTGRSSASAPESSWLSLLGRPSKRSVECRPPAPRGAPLLRNDRPVRNRRAYQEPGVVETGPSQQGIARTRRARRLD